MKSWAIQIAMVIAAFVPGAALGQQWNPPPMTQGEFDKIISTLRLSPEQLFEAQAACGFLIAERAGADRAMKAWDRWSADGPWSISHELMSRTGQQWERARRAWVIGIRKLDEDMFDALALIAPTQAATVESARWKWRRSWALVPDNRQTLPHGATFDLLNAVEESGAVVQAGGALHELLTAHASILDRMLRELDEGYPASRAESAHAGRLAHSAMKSGLPGDREIAIQALMEAWMKNEEQQWNFRQLNLRTIEAVLPLLDGVAAAKFKSSTDVAMSPFTHDPSKTPTSLASKEPKNVSPADLSRLRSLRTHFEERREAARQRLHVLYERTIALDTVREKLRQRTLLFFEEEGMVQPAPSEAQVAFDAAVSQWEREAESIGRDADAVMNAASSGGKP